MNGIIIFLFIFNETETLFFTYKKKSYLHIIHFKIFFKRSIARGYTHTTYSNNKIVKLTTIKRVLMSRARGSSTCVSICPAAVIGACYRTTASARTRRDFEWCEAAAW